MSFVPEITSYPIRLVFLAISIMCVAIGILLYMSSDIVPLAGEGVMLGVFTRLFKKKILSFMGLNGESIKKEEHQRAVA